MKHFKIFIIFFLAFLIRLIAINQSLWLDEGTTAKVVQNFGFTQIISGFSQMDFHPPLYYLFMKLWTSGFGYSEVALRFPSIMFSLLTGYFVYKMAKWLNGYIVGVWAVIFFLFNPLIIYYSQEARMYSMATFLLTGGLYFIIKKLTSLRVNELENNDSGRASLARMTIVLPGVFFSLALLTFYGSVFFIAALLIWLLIKKKFKLFFVTCFMLCITCLILSSLLIKQLQNARSSLQIVTNWSLVLGKANIKNLLLIPIKFTSGRISWEPKLSYYMISGLWLMVNGYWFVKGGLKNKLLFYCFIVPLLMGFIVSFITPLLQYFRFLYLIPILSIILALASKQHLLDREKVVIMTGFLIFSLVYLLNPQFHREDWKSLAASIPKNIPVYAIPSSMDALFYYQNDLRFKIYDLRFLDQSNKVTWQHGNSDLIVIPYTSEIYGVNYRKKFEEKRFMIKQTKSFRGLTVEKWITY